jgi:hypothetical protein
MYQQLGYLLMRERLSVTIIIPNHVTEFAARRAIKLQKRTNTALEYAVAWELLSDLPPFIAFTEQPPLFLLAEREHWVATQI